LAQDEKKRLFVHDILKNHGKDFKGSMQVLHLADYLATDEVLDRIEERLVRPLAGLRVGTHYGCHFFRPSRIMQDRDLDPRYPLPESMELVLEALGARVVEYNRQDLCCGAAMGLNTGRTSEALQITEEKVAWMNEAGLDALAVACPTCFTQFDTGQMMLRRKIKGLRTFPVYHLAELVAYALGADPARLDLESHKIKTGLNCEL
jgi:heterodisulfide reductase subunit B